MAAKAAGRLAAAKTLSNLNWWMMKALSLGLLDQSGGEEGRTLQPLPPFAVISTWRVRTSMLMPANAVYRRLQVSETVTFVVRFVVRSVPVDHDATCAVGSMNERKIQH